MENENSPFGTFQPQPAPMFDEAAPKNSASPATTSADPSPKRKSRRSKATAAPSSPASSAPKARRKYTRRVATPTPVATQKPVVAAPKPQVTGELDMVMAIIDSISHYDARTKQRILAAVARFS